MEVGAGRRPVVEAGDVGDDGADGDGQRLLARRRPSTSVAFG